MFSPVPTAVPPIGSSTTSRKVARIASSLMRIWSAWPENSWPSVSGVASWRWVRPIFTMSSNARAFDSRVARSRARAGSSRSVVSTATAMWIALGKTSLVDCERLT